MTEPEKFLERWSRRKREAADEPVAPASEAKLEKKEQAAQPEDTPPAAQSPKALDLSQLPPIDSIAAETDVRMFLQKGVPPDLTREALRRAWSTDPAIRDFVGLVENGWDFNDPNAMAGFGPIGTDDAARLLTQIIGAPEGPKPAELPPVAAAQDKTPQSQDLPLAEEQAAPADDSPSKDNSASLQRTKDIATQKDSDV